MNPIYLYGTQKKKKKKKKHNYLTIEIYKITNGNNTRDLQQSNGEK